MIAAAQRLAPRPSRTATVILAIYAAGLIFLGIRGLVPALENVATPYGREVGAWSMYGKHSEVLNMTAEVNGQPLKTTGMWYGGIVSPATPDVPEAVVDDYARFLHQQNRMSDSETVTVRVTYSVDHGTPVVVEGRYK